MKNSMIKKQTREQNRITGRNEHRSLMSMGETDLMMVTDGRGGVGMDKVYENMDG